MENNIIKFIIHKHAIFIKEYNHGITFYNMLFHATYADPNFNKEHDFINNSTYT